MGIDADVAADSEWDDHEGEQSLDCWTLGELEHDSDFAFFAGAQGRSDDV